jgi:DNA-directed RNA polymerase specialized sigma subunit
MIGSDPMSKLKDPKNQAKLDAFLREYAPLIKMHVSRLKGQGQIPQDIDESDLHLAGFRGLMEAVHRFDGDVAARTNTSENSNPFAKYASTRVRGRMLDHIHDKYSESVPKHIRTQAKNFAAANSQAPETAPTAQPTEPPKKIED